MRRGRKARHAAPPRQSAVDAGFTGGRFKPLTDSEIQLVHNATLDVLERIGVADPIPEVEEKALERGCWLDDDNRLHFPRSLVEDIVAEAPGKQVFHGQDPKYDLDLRDERVHTYGGGEAVTILDVGASDFRPSTLLDIYDAARLVDKLDNIHAFSRLVVATKMQGRLATDLNTAYASVAGTAKHTALTFAAAKCVSSPSNSAHRSGSWLRHRLEPQHRRPWLARSCR